MGPSLVPPNTSSVLLENELGVAMIPFTVCFGRLQLGMLFRYLSDLVSPLTPYPI